MTTFMALTIECENKDCLLTFEGSDSSIRIAQEKNVILMAGGWAEVQQRYALLLKESKYREVDGDLLCPDCADKREMSHEDEKGEKTNKAKVRDINTREVLFEGDASECLKFCIKKWPKGGPTGDGRVHSEQVPVAYFEWEEPDE